MHFDEIEQFVDGLFTRAEVATDQPETVMLYSQDGTSRRLPVREQLCLRCNNTRAHAVDGYSPHAWGWTGQEAQARAAQRVFPTRVGVDRCTPLT